MGGKQGIYPCLQERAPSALEPCGFHAAFCTAQGHVKPPHKPSGFSLSTHDRHQRPITAKGPLVGPRAVVALVHK